MRYLIIGGTSVFAELLTDRLIKKGNTEKVVLTKLPDENGFFRDNIEWYDLDIRLGEDVNHVVAQAKADVIFDFEGQNSVGYSWREPIETVDINISGTINLLNAVRDFSSHSRLIVGGSGEEYGGTDFSAIPLREESTPHPNNIYGATKACQTMFAKLYHQAFGLDIIVVRAFYEISVLQDEKFAIPSFCRQFSEMAAGKRDTVIYAGNLNNSRDFTDVRDLVRAFEAVAEKGRSGEVYNAARGEATTLLHIVRILEGLTGIHVTIKADADRFRPMDAPAVAADVSKIEKDCGWKAEIPLEDTIEKLLDYWKKKV